MFCEVYLRVNKTNWRFTQHRFTWENTNERSTTITRCCITTYETTTTQKRTRLALKMFYVFNNLNFTTLKIILLFCLPFRDYRRRVVSFYYFMTVCVTNCETIIKMVRKQRNITSIPFLCVRRKDRVLIN